MPGSPTDEELLSAALAGDERAFAELYRRWQGPMFRFARQMCGADGGAEDVVQEVFVALIENGQQFDPARGPLAAYLYGVARHQARRRLRTDGRYAPLDDARVEAEVEVEAEDGIAAVVDLNMDVGAVLDRRLSIDLVHRLVTTLPVLYREALILCDLHELGYAEAAAALGCPVGTVRSRLHRARALLADKVRSGAVRRGIAAS
jgi:RNA polymerase sigma-70 factor (ECF subfamily)